MLKKLTYVSRYAKLVDVDNSTALLPFSQKKETLCQLTLGTKELVHHWVTRQAGWYRVLNLQSSQAIANRSTCIVEIEDDESGQVIEQGYGYWTTRLSNSADMFYMYGNKVGLIISKSPNVPINIKVLYSSCLTFNVYLTPVSFGTQLDNIYINSPRYNANSIKNSLGVDWSYRGVSYYPPVISGNENIVLGVTAEYEAKYSSTNANNEIQFTNVSHSGTGNISPVAFGCIEENIGIYVGSLWEKVQQSGYYDLNPNGLYYSRNSGVDWNSVSVTDSRNTIDYSKTVFTKCVYGDGIFVGLVQTGNSVATKVASIYSLDGYSWSPLPWNSTTGGTFRDIAYYEGYFYIVGNDGKLYCVHPVWNSTTGVLTRFDTTLLSLNDSTYPNITQIKAVINFKDKSMLLLQVNTSGTTYVTRLYAYDSNTDAYTFVRNAVADMYAWKDYLVLHYSTGIMLSTDGLTWTDANSPVYYTYEFACGKEAMVVFGGNYKSGYITDHGMHYTLDGLNWNSCIINNSDRYSIPSIRYRVKGLYYSNGVFIAWINEYLYYSTDGINWDNASFADTRLTDRFDKRHIYVGSGSLITGGMTITYTSYATGKGLYVGIKSDGGSSYMFYSPFPPNNLLGFTKLT